MRHAKASVLFLFARLGYNHAFMKSKKDCLPKPDCLSTLLSELLLPFPPVHLRFLTITLLSEFLISHPYTHTYAYACQNRIIFQCMILVKWTRLHERLGHHICDRGLFLMYSKLTWLSFWKWWEIFYDINISGAILSMFSWSLTVSSNGLSTA